MDLTPYFRPVPTIAPNDVRELIKTRRREEYNLVDVRQMEEFVTGHLPGADIIPLGELGSRLTSIEAGKPTVVY
jgi:rhodanese-related sulfurtransferase